MGDPGGMHIGIMRMRGGWQGTVWGRGFAPSRPSLGSAVPEFGSFKESGQLGAVEEPAFPVWRGHSCPRIDCVGTAALGCPAAKRRHLS